LICLRLAALLEGLGIVDPCKGQDEAFDLGGVIDDALAMIIEQNPSRNEE